MNYKDLLLPLALALLTTWGLRYYFGSSPSNNNTISQATSGQRFVAPKSTEVEVHKPLNTEVDFLDDELVHRNPQITRIQTAHAQYQFSSYGASLERLEFKRNWAGKEGYLSTLFPPSTLDKEKRCFLLALNEKTPYYFTLNDFQEQSDKFIVHYSVDTNLCRIDKIFHVFKNSGALGVELTIEPHQVELQPRLFVASPLVAELGKDDIITGLVNDGQNNVQILPKNEELLTAYWAKPMLFGAQDRYFVHAMTADNNAFVQRGYFTVFDLEHLYAIMEGPSITQKTTWYLTYYLGPKTDEAMRDIDPRLVQTLNYGWFSFISRPVSKILLEILNYIYGFVKNYGVAIIILTLLMRLLMLPLTVKGMQGQRKMVDYQRKLKHIEERYRDDKQALAAARAELLAKQGIPGLSGCLPILLQAPFFIALSWVLSNAIELYKAPFLWIPDLSARDPYFILPVLAGLLMIVHNPNPDPKQKVSSLVMAVIFTAFIVNFAAGLTLFIAVSTLLGVLQMKLFKRS